MIGIGYHIGIITLIWIEYHTGTLTVFVWVSSEDQISFFMTATCWSISGQIGVLKCWDVSCVDRDGMLGIPDVVLRALGGPNYMMGDESGMACYMGWNMVLWMLGSSYVYVGGYNYKLRFD